MARIDEDLRSLDESGTMDASEVRSVALRLDEEVRWLRGRVEAMTSDRAFAAGEARALRAENESLKRLIAWEAARKTFALRALDKAVTFAGVTSMLKLWDRENPKPEEA